MQGTEKLQNIPLPITTGDDIIVMLWKMTFTEDTHKHFAKTLWDKNMTVQQMTV